MIKRFNLLVETEKKLNATISKCRQWVREVWKQKLDVHDENTMVALSAELMKNGADEDQIQMFCNIMLGKDYDRHETSYKWSYIKPYPWSNEELKSNLPSHILPYIKQERGREYNPQAVDPEIANRTKLYKKQYYIIETKDAIEFHDRSTKKKVSSLRKDIVNKKIFDDNYLNSDTTVEVNENNSAFYAYYMQSLKDKGIPVTQKWIQSSKTCQTRVFKKMYDDEAKGWVTEIFIVYRTKHNGKWSQCGEYVPYFTPMHSEVKKAKIRKMFQNGIDVATLQQVFGYKSKEGIYKIVRDLMQKGKGIRKTSKCQLG